MKLVAALVVILAGVAHAEDNLLANPDFDLDPTINGNGWSAAGTGVLEWNQLDGDPSPPSAMTFQEGAESMLLFQCVPIVGGMTYDFSARSFTHAAIGASENSVALSVYSTADCSGSPIETVETDQTSFPGFALRERIGYVVPAGAVSARIELRSDANGDISRISWDDVILSEHIVAVDAGSWGRTKSTYR